MDIPYHGKTERSVHLINHVVPSCRTSKVPWQLISASSSGPNTCTLLSQLGGLCSIAAACTSRKTKATFLASIVLLSSTEDCRSHRYSLARLTKSTFWEQQSGLRQLCPTSVVGSNEHCWQHRLLGVLKRNYPQSASNEISPH